MFSNLINFYQSHPDMSSLGEDSESGREILYLNFNQTSTALSVGSKSGYMLYDLDQIHECRPTYESRNMDDICIIERNFSTSLIAYVSLHSPRNLVLYNYKKGTEITQKLFPNTVLAVKLNRKNVVVCLEDSIFILYIMGLRDENTHSITNTPTNLKGLCALTYGNKNSLLAYPGSSVNGDVQIFDATDRCAKMTIPAHSSQLAALAFDEDGEKLATASIKGTVIRVFCVATGHPLFEFRRGVKRCVAINSLNFSKDAEFLCASSNTETVHVFKLSFPETPEHIDEEAEGWMEMFGRVLSQSAKYLPTQVSDVLTQQRSFATVHLPFVGHTNIATITRIQNMPYVIIASLEGFLYVYELNTEVGGPCILLKQHRLEGPLIPCLVRKQFPSALATTVDLKPENEVNGRKSPENIEKVSVCDPTPCLQPVVAVQQQQSTEECIPPEISNNHDLLPSDAELPPLLNKVE